MCGYIGAIVSVAVLLAGNINTAYANNPYALGAVEYFHSSNIKKHQKPKSYELAFNKEGNIPEPLGVLLESPTEDNAKLYLQWLKEREMRMKKVQELIEKVSRDEAMSH